MKNVLLGILALASYEVSAQTYTANDTLSTGDSETYYVADSSAADLEGITGTGVTWDYSSLFTYTGTTSLDTIKDASNSADFGDYPNAVYHDDLAGGASNYFTNYEDSVLSYGYTFSLDGNDAKIMHNIDPLKMMELPMAEGQTYSDSTYGTAEVYGNSATTSGNVVVTADGTGTLSLGTTDFTNVIRIKLDETIAAIIDLGMLGTANGTVTRTVYSYYDLANQNEAILIHATINVNSNLFNGGYTAVYSSVDIEGASVEESISGADVSVYPNPANNMVSITAPQGTDQLIIMNAIGQTVQTFNNPSTKTSIDVVGFEKGMFFVQIKKGEGTITKKLIVR
jgi:hypothetical protein